MNEPIKKDNRGYLYPNKNKNKPTQPDFTGKALVDGKEWRISAWENQTPEGNKYLSLAFSVPPTNTANPENTNTANTASNTPTNTPSTPQVAAPIADDLDLDAILNSVDDDNPF